MYTFTCAARPAALRISRSSGSPTSIQRSIAPVRSFFTRSGSSSFESPRPNSSAASAFSAKARSRTIMRASVSEGWRAMVSECVAKWWRSRSETVSSALKMGDLSATSVQRDLAFEDHRRPAVALYAQVSGEFLGRAADHFHQLVVERGGDFGLPQHGEDVAADAVEQRRGRTRGGDDSDPRSRIEVGQALLLERRDIGQLRRSLPGADADRLELPPPDLRHPLKR